MEEVEDAFKDLVAYLKKSRADDWEAILMHRNAPTQILIEFSFDGMDGKKQHRVYEVRRSHAGAYNSKVSGGQEHFTTELQGPNGESIKYYREWVVSEIGYIGSFRCLEDLAVLILHQLRGGDLFVVSDALHLVPA